MADENKKQVEDQVNEEAAGKSKHDERVAKIAEGIASLVTKGEEVVSSLNARAEEAGFSFDEKAAEADTKINEIATKMEAHAEKAINQITQDFETIAKTVDERTKGE